MYESELMGAVNNMFNVNDRLGVELMGAGAWNGLKRAVTTISANAIRKANATKPRAVYGGNVSAIKKAIANATKKKRVFINGLDDPLCRELWGLNEDYAAELLGYDFGDFGRQVKNLTHKILEAGENIPIASAAVSEARKYGDMVQTALGLKKTGEDVVTTVYDNRGKIILIGGGAAILLYLLLRKKKGRR